MMNGEWSELDVLIHVYCIVRVNHVVQGICSTWMGSVRYDHFACEQNIRPYTVQSTKKVYFSFTGPSNEDRDPTDREKLQYIGSLKGLKQRLGEISWDFHILSMAMGKYLTSKVGFPNRQKGVVKSSGPVWLVDPLAWTSNVERWSRRRKELLWVL